MSAFGQIHDAAYYKAREVAEAIFNGSPEGEAEVRAIANYNSIGFIPEVARDIVRGKDLDHRTKAFADTLQDQLQQQGWTVTDPFESGNINDGPGWVIEATREDGFTMNIEIAGPAYQDED